MKDEPIKLVVNSQLDREKITSALANSGYPVWVEKVEHLIEGDSYWVCILGLRVSEERVTG